MKSSKTIRDLKRLINRELRYGRCDIERGRRVRACNIPGTREAGKIAMWRSMLRLELADDGLPLSDIDPKTGWMYGEVGA